VTISRFQVEFIVNFRVMPNSRNGVYAHTNRLKSRNESVNSASHKHSICVHGRGPLRIPPGALDVPHQDELGNDPDGSTVSATR